jgi:chromosome segregation ATPase
LQASLETLQVTANSLTSENQRLCNDKKLVDQELMLANNAMKELSQALRRTQDNLDKSESRLRNMDDYSSLERSVRDKDASFQRIEQQLRDEIMRRESCEVDFRNYKGSMQRTEDAVKSMTEDVRKVRLSLLFDYHSQSVLGQRYHTEITDGNPIIEV